MSTVSTTRPGKPWERIRWRKIGGETRRVSLMVQLPEVAELYYSVCSRIDRHNRCRQDDLNLEKKFQVKEWSARVNTTLLAICVVDSWLLYKGGRSPRPHMTQNAFYERLATALIDNSYDQLSTRRFSKSTPPNSPRKVFLRSGHREHLTPKKKKSGQRESHRGHRAREMQSLLEKEVQIPLLCLC